jgi:hypothetical protein
MVMIVNEKLFIKRTSILEISSNKKMEMAFQLNEIQRQQFLELYKTLQSENVTIQMTPSKINIQTEKGSTVIDVIEMGQNN